MAARSIHRRAPLVGALAAWLLASCGAPQRFEAASPVPGPSSATSESVASASTSAGPGPASPSDGDPLADGASLPPTGTDDLPLSDQIAARPQEDPADQPGVISGRLSTRLRGRASRDESDVDLDAVLSVEVGDPATDDMTAHLLGRGVYDVDGKQTNDGAFASLDDTYDGRVTGRLHDAWIDFHRVGPLERVRVGRQTRYDTPVVVTFDGIETQLAERGDLRWKGGAYAGQTYHGYESSPDQDAVYGLWAQARPWRGGRARLDLMNLRDDTNAGKLRNDFVALGFWQTLTESLRMHGEWTQIDGETRDVQLDATWYDAPSDLLVQVTRKELRSTQPRRVLELDPYFIVLREYAPYDETRARIAKGFDDDASVELGVDTRRLADNSDEAAFNREFERWFLTGTLYDVTMEGLSLALTGENWDGDGDDVRSWGLDVTRDHDENTRISAGSYYSLFKNDFLLDEEREHVRTYYLRLRHKTSADTTWTVGYEKEVARLDIQTLTAKMSWRF